MWRPCFKYKRFGSRNTFQRYVFIQYLYCNHIVHSHNNNENDDNWLLQQCPATSFNECLQYYTFVHINYRHHHHCHCQSIFLENLYLIKLILLVKQPFCQCSQYRVQCQTFSRGLQHKVWKMCRPTSAMALLE